MKLEQTIANVLNIPVERVVDTLSVDTCDEWNSLEQIALISALESAYAVEFDIAESIEMDSVEGIRIVLENKGIDVDA